MASVATHKLEVLGADLYYESRGSGPLLLCIPGGPADAGAFDALANELGDTYTVVTYDPRGNSRSKLHGAPEDQLIEQHSEDAHQLASALTTEPAYLFGSSGGALVGLDLIARHPHQFKVFVAHEPSVFTMLPDWETWRNFFQEVYDTFRSAGAGPAMYKFSEGLGLDGPPEGEDLSPEAEEAMARMGGNIDFFVSHVMLRFAAFVPDFDALGRASTCVVVAGGEQSRERPHPVYNATLELARGLDTSVHHFPGHHGGFGTHPAEFADRLREVLANSGTIGAKL